MLNLTSALRQHFRYPAFRLEQEEALTHVLAGRDALWVSPLVALMKDRADSLTRRLTDGTELSLAHQSPTQRLHYVQRNSVCGGGVKAGAIRVGSSAAGDRAHPLYTQGAPQPACFRLHPEYEGRAMALFSEHLRRYVAGEPLWNVVELERWY